MVDPKNNFLFFSSCPKFIFSDFFLKILPAGFLFTHTLYFTSLLLMNDNFLIQWLKVVKYATMGCLFRVLSLSLCIKRMNSINFIHKIMKVSKFYSSDTNVSKFVFEWSNPKGIAESVLYRYGSYRERTVICCSIQSGCPVGCTFCGTGKFFVRNLTKNEIIAQVKRCLSTIDCNTREIKKFQIMFMSMGEPFLNYKELKLAIIELHDLYPNADLLVSTSAPSVIYRHIGDFIELSQRISKVGLQFSVHESTDENRRKLIPTNTCTLRQISAIGELWSSFVGRKPFYNYCVHNGNCDFKDACRLVDLFKPDVWETTLSVICEKDESVASSIDRQLDMIRDFSTHMTSQGASIRVFNPAGQDDIGGGCGQLWYFQEWLKNNEK